MKQKLKIALYKYVRTVKPISGRFFSNVAVIKSYPGLFVGFSEYIINLISFLQNLFIGEFESTVSVSAGLTSCRISSEGIIEFGENTLVR